jgi:hypothetical protein
MLFEEGVKKGFYARVSRLAKQWFELDLHFLSLGGGEIALGYWFEEVLLPYLKNSDKLKEVKSISIVTGYGKTRTRGRRQGDDGMRKRTLAMLRFMNIHELEQPNLGRIHIDMEALQVEVEKNGGRIVYDHERYNAWKERETTINIIPDVPQKIRPRYRPANSGSKGPPFTRIETDATSPEYLLTNQKEPYDATGPAAEFGGTPQEYGDGPSSYGPPNDRSFPAEVESSFRGRQNGDVFETSDDRGGPGPRNDRAYSDRDNCFGSDAGMHHNDSGDRSGNQGYERGRGGYRGRGGRGGSFNGRGDDQFGLRGGRGDRFGGHSQEGRSPDLHDRQNDYDVSDRFGRDGGHGRGGFRDGRGRGRGAPGRGRGQNDKSSYNRSNTADYYDRGDDNRAGPHSSSLEASGRGFDEPGTNQGSFEGDRKRDFSDIQKANQSRGYSLEEPDPQRRRQS